MLKVVGILLLCLTVVLSGLFYVWKLSFRKRYLEGLVGVCENCAQTMRSKNYNIFEILAFDSKRELSFLSEMNNENISDALEICSILNKSGITKDDQKLICDFLQGLGKSDLKGQTEYCQYYADCFKVRLTDASNTLEEKGRLIRSLSLLAASAIFVILI